MKYTDIYLDIDRPDDKIYDYIQRGEKDSRGIKVHLLSSGQDYTIPSGLIARVQYDKPDKKTVFKDVVIDYSNSAVVIDYNEQMCTTGGDCSGKIGLYKGASGTFEGSLMKSTLFRIRVLDGMISEDAIISSDEFSALTKALNEVEQVIDGGNEAIENMEELSQLVTAQESTRQSNETTRVSNETTRKSNETTRVSNENTRKTNETTRQSQESSRVTAEEGRVSAESTRATSESARVTAENTRKSNETGRVNAETARSTAESSRASAESTRVSSESTRVTNEDTRKSNEATRVSNENTRKSNETTRQSQESTRVTSESGRVSAETARATAESNRVNAETARATAEGSRVTAESTRKVYEIDRVNAETARATAETGRVNAESTRVTNEDTRKSNETIRQSQEQARQTNTVKAIDNANDAAQNANDKADYAEEKGDYAYQKGQEAQAIVTSAAPIINENLQATYSDKATQTGEFLHVEVSDDALVQITELKGKSTQTITIQGKNILPRVTRAATTINGVTFTPNVDGSITMNGTATATVYFYLYETVFGDVEPVKFHFVIGTQYTIKKQVGVGIHFGYGEGTFLGLPPNTQEYYTYTCTFDKNISWVRIYILNGQTVNNLVYYPQVEIGSESTSYVPFTPDSPSPEYPSPIYSVGDSDFDIVSTGNNLAKNPLYFASNQYNGCVYTMADLKPNTMYTISLVVPEGRKYYTNEYLFGTPVNTITGSGIRRTLTVTTLESLSPSNAVHFTPGRGWILFKNSTGYTSDNSEQFLQIDLGLTATDYEPYKEDRKTISAADQKLRSLPNGVANSWRYNDAGEFGYWQRVGFMTNDGTAPLVYDAVYTSSIIRGIIRLDPFDSSSYPLTYISGLCNRFQIKNTSISPTVINTATLAINSNTYGMRLYFVIPRSEIESPSATTIKTWLNSHPLTIQYELREPIFTPLSSIFLKSYKSITNVFTTAEIQPDVTGIFRSELWSRDAEMLINGVDLGEQVAVDSHVDGFVRESVFNNEVTSLNSALANVCDVVYPVGSIYMSTALTSPSALFGGTWVQLKDRFLLGAGDTYASGATGGAATHTLTTAQMPSHTHSIPALSGTAASAGNHSHNVTAATNQNFNVTPTGGVGAGFSWGTTGTTSTGAHTHTVTTVANTTGSNGSGSAHNNMPPYLVVYMWGRTA